MVGRHVAAALEQPVDAGRLSARPVTRDSGPKIKLEISDAGVDADVQGAVPFRTPSQSASVTSRTSVGRRGGHALAGKALFAAKSSSGEMPENVEAHSVPSVPVCSRMPG